MAELVDALDLGSNAARRGGSSPSIRTNLLELISKRWIFYPQYFLPIA